MRLFQMQRLKNGCKHLGSALLALGLCCAFYSSAFGQGIQKSSLARNQGRVLNGVPVKPGQAPWNASLRLDNTHNCGGSFISPQLGKKKEVIDWLSNDENPRWLLTAAHCVVDDSGKIIDKDRLTALGGTLSIEQSDGGEIQKVTFVDVHKNYNASTLENDIALLRLAQSKKDLKGDRKSIIFPRVRDGVWITQPYVALTVSGWGRTETGFASSTLLEVMLPRVDRDSCAKKYAQYGDYIGPGMICAGFVSGEYDSCQGDSGGPLFYRPAQSGNIVARSPTPLLVGVVSWGRGCGNAELFGVYTNALVYEDWVKSRISHFLNQ